jgi:hypothetical protein
MKKKDIYVDKVYRLTKDAAPLSFMLPTRNSQRFPLLWFDEQKGENRALRYARNQRSPFEDEQDGNAIVEPIIFEDGFLRVSRTNQALQKFLHYHPYNGKRFIEVNEAKTAEVEIETLNLEVDALIEAKELTIEQSETLYRVLFGQDPTMISSSELKRDLLIYAKKQPKIFLDAISDPMLKLQSTVQSFFDNKLLAFRNNKRDVYFNLDSNKKKLLTVPYGEEPIDILCSYFKSDEGVEILKFLEKKSK